MSAPLDDLTARFEAAVEAVHRAEVGSAALRLLAAHARVLAPHGTHMLIESSDQGSYMCSPHRIEGPEPVDVDWEYAEQHDLDSAASWLSWSDSSWQEYADAEHPYTNARAGYFAIDIARVLADTPV